MGVGLGVDEVDPDWLGFHIALTKIPFLSCGDWAAKAVFLREK
jgi:hypothetical protein